MGRRAQGPAYRPIGEIWAVRFRHNGKRHEYSTGVRVQPGEERAGPEAAAEGARIVAAVVAGKRPTRSSVAATRRLTAEAFSAILGEWIDELPVREVTRAQYDVYTGQWVREWGEGPIFGAHRYDRFLRRAAAKVLPAAKAAIFTGQHIRSAAITRLLERSANLAGTMHLAGHRHPSTTSGYLRPSLRAAEEALAALEEKP